MDRQIMGASRMKLVPFDFANIQAKILFTPHGAEIRFDMVDAATGQRVSGITPEVRLSKDAEAVVAARHLAVERAPDSGRYVVTLDREEFDGASVLLVFAQHPECLLTSVVFDLAHFAEMRKLRDALTLNTRSDK